MNWMGYYLVYLAPLVTVIAMTWGRGVFYFSTIIAVFGVVPFLDNIIGDDHLNPRPETERQLSRQKRYSWALYGFVPLHLALLIWGCYAISHGPSGLHKWWGLLLSIGLINGGLSINIAHELCHRNTPLEQTLAKMVWFSVGYMHFHIEHMDHHVKMGTPEDPATARLGESVYRFYLRSIPNSYLSAWRLERKRLKRKGISTFSYQNQMFWFAFLPLLFCLYLYGLWGWQAGLFYILQCGLAIFALETINYLEHYGLKRKKLATGKYEPVDVRHSWNSSKKMTNYFLFKLQRHSEHHMFPGRRYQILRETIDGPQLPTGYGGMFLLALCPPLWRKIMDPKIQAYNKQCKAP